MPNNIEFIIIKGAGDSTLTIRRDDFLAARIEDRVLSIYVRGLNIPLELDLNSDLDPREIIKALNTDTPTPPAEPDEPQTKTLHINRIVRGVTSKSASPMWTLFDDEADEKVNTFKHAKPEINDWATIALAGYANMFNSMVVDQERTCDPPIPVTVRKDGDWWKLVSIDNPLTPITEPKGPTFEAPPPTGPTDDEINAVLDDLKNTSLLNILEGDDDELDRTDKFEPVKEGEDKSAENTL